MREMWFDLWVGKIAWRRKWQPTPEFLLGKSHGQRNLVGYSPWGHKWVRYDFATKQQQFIYFWLCWGFMAVHKAFHCGDLLLQSTGCRRTGFSRWDLQPAGSRARAQWLWYRGLSCSEECGVFLDQRLNPCPLHWQADSRPLYHQGSPLDGFGFSHLGPT